MPAATDSSDLSMGERSPGSSRTETGSKDCLTLDTLVAPKSFTLRTNWGIEGSIPKKFSSLRALNDSVQQENGQFRGWRTEQWSRLVSGYPGSSVSCGFCPSTIRLGVDHQAAVPGHPPGSFPRSRPLSILRAHNCTAHELFLPHFRQRECWRFAGAAERRAWASSPDEIRS